MRFWPSSIGASLLAIAVLGAGLGMACANEEQGKARSQPSGPLDRPVHGIAVNVKTDKKTYALSEPIQITLTVKNTSGVTARLPFSSGKQYDIEIRRGKGRNGAKVWQWSQGKMFTQMLITRSLPPGKTMTFSATYKPETTVLKDKEGMTPGTYTVIGILTTMGRMPRPSGATVITVH
ncbi:MAG TPA: BsuPI-related putative proteinase inhibitor [Chthonomonadaceae bacterium]|nr:BsuPI-related putative proteinase inhibitor [Chthonomonadaceae bacterium]